MYSIYYFIRIIQTFRHVFSLDTHYKKEEEYEKVVKIH